MEKLIKKSILRSLVNRMLCDGSGFKVIDLSGGLLSRKMNQMAGKVLKAVAAAVEFSLMFSLVECVMTSLQ